MLILQGDRLRCPVNYCDSILQGSPSPRLVTLLKQLDQPLDKQPLQLELLIHTEIEHINQSIPQLRTAQEKGWDQPIDFSDLISRVTAKQHELARIFNSSGVLRHSLAWDMFRKDNVDLLAFVRKPVTPQVVAAHARAG